jgi:ornithine cyclodeaminase
LSPGSRRVAGTFVRSLLFDSVGFAIEDFSALQYVRERVAETGFCEVLDMIADPDDTQPPSRSETEIA